MSKRLRRWTKEEIEILRTEFPKGGIAQLAVRLNRSMRGVHGYGWRLGLRVSTEARRLGHAQPRGNKSLLFKGCGKVSGSYIDQLRRNSSIRLQPFILTAQYLDSITTKVCPLSGRSLVYPETKGIIEVTASIDRIDSSKGYIEGNVRWIHKDVNIMRSNMTDEVLLSWVRDIAGYYHE